MNTTDEIRMPLALIAPGEYQQALIKASQMAMAKSRVIYIYSDQVMYWACSTYQGKFLAKCWPGGKVISRKDWKKDE